MKGGAEISANELYRYHLWRRIDNARGTGKVVFIMLNPSTADWSKDDPTIRRCVDFTRTFMGSVLSVVNLYAFRATSPAELWQQANPEGPENRTYIQREVYGASKVIAAWGNHGARNGAGSRLLDALDDMGIDVHCLGLTEIRQPRHPLYVPKKTRLVRLAEALARR